MPDTALITASAALIGAALGASITNSIAKRNLKKEISLKMAEYRLQWINNLGKEFADFSANAATFLMFSKEGSKPDIFKSVLQSRYQIIMLMNRNDQDYDKLTRSMKAITDFAGGRNEEDLDQSEIDGFYRLVKDFLEISNGILKREWQKTKRHLKEDTIDVSALRSESTEVNNSYYIYHTPYQK